MRTHRTERRAIISNRQLIAITQATNRATSDKIRALLDAMPAAIKTAAILGRSAGRMLKAVRDYDEAMSRLRLYGVKATATIQTNSAKSTPGAKYDQIIFDEVTRLNEVSASNDLRNVFGSNDLKSVKKGGFGGVSVADRGPKRNLIQRSKAALMQFRAFASRKNGKPYRVERWRRG
jgi:hypothetical protein